jgi:hypothetical protein
LNDIGDARDRAHAEIDERSRTDRDAVEERVIAGRQVIAERVDRLRELVHPPDSPAFAGETFSSSDAFAEEERPSEEITFEE